MKLVKQLQIKQINFSHKFCKLNVLNETLQMFAMKAANIYNGYGSTYYTYISIVFQINNKTTGNN